MFMKSPWLRKASPPSPRIFAATASAAPATAPVVNPPDTVSAQAGTPFSFQITATNTNVPPVSYEVLDTPVWMTLDPKTGLLAGTPTAPGKIKVQRIAKNSAGASTARELTIAIAAAPDTPVVTGLRDISGTVGQALVAFQVAATPTASSFIATSLPPGLKMSAGGAITGTPTASGTFKIMLSGVNAKGIGTPVEITFTIAQSFSLTPGGN